ncbi:MAG: 4-hydroxythreonine-4-phosphate dehydrogenase PdxA, partial [Nitrospirota bacterium]|nr:4-hydroxythreonine-4-phosphate dehydrogenase PdxA [Nitrospirota bacterium]
MRTFRKIAVTMGEPGGVGPEIIARALCRPDVTDRCVPVVIGSAAVMEEAVRLTHVPLKVRSIRSMADSRPGAGFLEVLEVSSRLSAKKGVPSAAAGRAVVSYIRKAVGLALKNEVDAVVTGPISKESLKMAGHKWPGHTELLAELTDTKDFAMMFAAEKLKVILCTIHIPLKDVPKKITERLVLRTIRLARAGAAMLGAEGPRIAVAGLNPHAGEAGIMGKEEIRSIAPAIQRALKEGINVSGPYPPDVLFHRAYNGGFDMIVCMYHDQGLIPFKMLA